MLGSCRRAVAARARRGESAVRRAAWRGGRARAVLRAARRSAAAPHSTGWHGVVFTGNPPLGLELGLKATRAHVLLNGPIECRLLSFEVPEREGLREETWARRAAGVRQETPPALAGAEEVREPPSQEPEGARRVGTATKRLTCYRVYDADLPEYALLDRFVSASARRMPDDPRRWFTCKSTSRPTPSIPAKARAPPRRGVLGIPEVLGIARDRVHLRVRRTRRAASQYEKLAERGEFHKVAARPACSFS